MMQILARQLGKPVGWFSRWMFSSLWNRRNKVLNDAAFNLLNLPEDARVLEVGFGGGYLLGKIAGELDRRALNGFLAGVDHSIEMVRVCEKRFLKRIRAGQIHLAQANAMALPFSSSSISNFVSVNSIFYWADPILAISEAARVLIPQGQFVLVFTCHEDMRRRSFSAHGLRLFEPEEIEKHLRRVGIEQISVTMRKDQYRDFWCLIGVKEGRLE